MRSIVFSTLLISSLLPNMASAQDGMKSGDVIVPPPYTTMKIGNPDGIGTFTRDERCWSERNATMSVLAIEERRTIVLYTQPTANPKSTAFCPDGTVGILNS